MKTLNEKIKASREQLPIIANPKPGIQVIRGAAGSGKTTTALLMLHQMATLALSRRTRLGLDSNVNILVLAFNRTLKGYIENLAQSQIQNFAELNLSIMTFAKWGLSLFPRVNINEAAIENQLKRLSADLPYEPDFVHEEVDYLLGRFKPDDLRNYLVKERVGRGLSPRVDKKKIFEVVQKYCEWKNTNRIEDWNDLAVKLYSQPAGCSYDIIIVDEAQDFSANRIRALMHYAAKDAYIILVVDTAQKIYKSTGFAWTELGLTVKSHVLKENHRNTCEICEFALPLVADVDIDEDGSLPDLTSCKRHGAKPKVLEGSYPKQVKFATDYICKKIDLARNSVIFLHPLGWFRDLKPVLDKKGLGYVDITRKDEWPQGQENIALSTIHSAKGLEFDYVFILGLDRDTTPHGTESGDITFETLRKMLAMSVTRAREMVIIGYNPDKPSSLVHLFKEGTFEKVKL